MALFVRTLRFNSISRGLKMSAQLRAEKVLDEMKSKNPYFEKYASKIAILQQNNPENFNERLEEIDKKTKPKKIVVDEKPREYSELLHPKKELKTSDIGTSTKRLEDIMKIELLQNKSADEIRHIWLEYHKQKDVIAAVIPVEKFDEQMICGKDYPTFLLPLPRSQGYEFFLLQFSAASVHFTTLLCYQVHKENAPECLNMVHYSELRDKGVILMRGEFDKNVINAKEAQCLANQMQLYYTQNDKRKLELLEKFTKAPDSFTHADLIRELENLSL